jgi:ribonuclease HI
MAGEIILYTDGSARGNPGPGGYGVILISGKHSLEKSEGYKFTTNNRMELMAVITGLEALKIPNSKVVIYTDSKYVADAVEKKWVFLWESNAFKKKKNSDLWIRFLKVYRKHNVRFEWIKGHNNNPENDKCDQLAVEASKRSILLEDSGFDPEQKNELLFNQI